MSDVIAVIHVKCELPEMVNRKWQNQQEIGLCLQLCRWSPLGPAWRLFSMTHFNSTWGARSWQHKHTDTLKNLYYQSHSFHTAHPCCFLKESHFFSNPEGRHVFNY